MGWSDTCGPRRDNGTQEGSWFAAEIDKTGEPPFAGQAMDSRQEALQAGESLRALQFFAGASAAFARVVPAAGDLSRVLGHVFDGDQFKARALQGSLVRAG